MPVRVKKLIGTVLLVALVVVYALVASAVAVARLPGTGTLTHVAFFLISGLLWVLPAMALVSWMQKPGKPRS